jgi:general secretion pathway protein G
MIVTSSLRTLQNTGPRRPQLAGGFSLFELVVFIISVAIIYAYAANRFADFPGQAERANFLAVTTQISSAVNLEMLYGVGVGRIASPQALAGANPMELLLEPPANYIGAFDAVDPDRLDRRIWYFDRSSQELVYLINDATGVALLINGREVPTNEIRFRLEADYSMHDEETGLPVRVLESAGEEVPEDSRVREFNGIVMRPVTPYKWGEVEYGVLLQEAVAQRS